MSEVKELPINNAVSPEQLAAQQEAMEFNKMAAMSQYHINRASAIMNALAIGGDSVRPLFEEEDRKDLEAKLAQILKKI
jgi:hypothetical protein